MSTALEQVSHLYCTPCCPQLDERYVIVNGGLFDGVTVRRVGTPKDIHIGEGLTSFHVQPIPDKVMTCS